MHVVHLFEADQKRSVLVSIRGGGGRSSSWDGVEGNTLKFLVEMQKRFRSPRGFCMSINNSVLWSQYFSLPYFVSIK